MSGPPEPPSDDRTPRDTAEERREDVLHPLVVDLMLEPHRWEIWPAVAVLRWVLRSASASMDRRITYRSRPSLSFSPSEIDNIALPSIEAGGIELTLNAPGLAAPGSPLPTADIARIINDRRNGGALALWLDAPTDRFMQAVEASEARFNAAFALATGGHVTALQVCADLVGRSAPLGAAAGGALFDLFGRRATGNAQGLAAMFCGPVSAAGLASVFRAFTGLEVHIEEFAGEELIVLHPARVGGPFHVLLGSTCRLPSAGVEVHIEGGDRSEAQDWARDPVRRSSLYLLALSYIGSTSPAARVFLHLEPDNAPPAALDGKAAFGGLAVLGKADRPVTLPLAG